MPGRADNSGFSCRRNGHIKGEFIKTVRGGGHMLAADVTEEAIER